MSTRSYISYEMKNGSYSGVYCHHDGYPGCVGATLLKKYNSSNIMKLIDLGNFSSLGISVFSIESKTGFHHPYH